MSRLTGEILNTIAAAEKGGKKIREEGTDMPCIEVALPDRTLLIPDPYFDQPPITFEKKHGISGVSHIYQLPPHVTARDLQTYALLTYMGDNTDEECHSKLQSLWRSLRFYNPSLRTLQYNSTSSKHLFDLAMGVASGFNETDIQAFIFGTGLQAEKMWKSAEYKKLTNVFNRYAGKRTRQEDLALHWVAAPATLKIIEDQFAAKTSAAHKRKSAP